MNLALWDNHAFLDLVVDNATSVWIFDAQFIGQFAIFMLRPARDKDEIIKVLSPKFYVPEKSASAHVSVC